MFKPGNLGPQKVIGASKQTFKSKDDLIGLESISEKHKSIITQPVAYDIEQNLENLIYIDGAASSVYNDSEIFDKDRLISLASIDFERSELEDLLDLFDAKIFEGKLDRTLLQEIYSRADLKKLGPQLEKLESEISLARNRLAAAKSLHQIIRNTERSLVDPERKKRIQQIFNQLTRERKENSLVKISDDLDIDVFAAIEEITLIPKDVLEYLPPTYLYMQLCEELKQMFYEGGPPNLFLSTHITSPSRRDQFQDIEIREGELAKVWKLYNESSQRKAINKVGLSKNNITSDYVYGNKPASRITAGRNSIKTSGHFSHIAQVCTMLANEYRLSAGIGRLAGNKIAFKYGLSETKERPFQSMFGGQNVNYIYKNYGLEGSVQSLGIVGKEGQLQQSGVGAVNKVALFDGYVNTVGTTGGTGKYKYMDVRTAFMKDIKNNPTNNKLDVLDKVIAKGEQAFAEINDLLTESTCSEEDVNILTPQGLFIRVLEEFCKLIKFKGFEGDEVARAEQLAGTHLLNLTHPFYSDSLNSWHGVLKHRLNVFIIRLLSRRREATGVIVDKQVRLSPKEFSNQFQSNLEEVAFDRRVIAEVMITFSNFTQSYGHSTIHNAGANAQHILTDANEFTSKYYKSEAVNYTLNRQFSHASVLNGNDFIDVNRDADGSEGFLRSIANIFEEMEKEAMKLAGEGSYVNQQRLTNNSGLDAALTTAMILECFCALSRQFSDTHFLLGANVDNAEESAHVATSTGEEGSDNLVDLSYLQYGDYVGALRSIKTTENAHDHITGAASVQFVENFSNTESGMMLREYYNRARNYVKYGVGNGFNMTAETEANLGAGEILEMIGYNFGGSTSSATRARAVIKDFDSQDHFIEHVATKLRNRGAHAFAAARHVLLHNQGSDAGRQTMLEILAAAKDGDLDQLFTDPNNPEETFLAGDGFLPYGKSMSKQNNNYKPQQLIDALQRTAIADVAHTRLFDVCRAMFIHLQESTAEMSRAAAALRAASPTGIVHRGTQIADPNAQLQALVRLSKTQSGRKLIKSFSSRQLELVEKRLQSLEAADENTAYMIDPMRPETEAAIRMYLDHSEIKSGVKKGKFIFFGIPAGKLEDLIYNKNAEKISVEGYDSSQFTSVLDESFEDAELEIKLYPLDEINPGIKYKKPNYIFPLNIDIDEAGIATAFESENQPKTFNELTRRCEFKLDSPLTPEIVRVIGDGLTEKYGLDGLKSVLSSFLIKKFAEVTYGMNFAADELILSEVEPSTSNFPDPNRSSTAFGLLEDLSSVFLPLAGNDVNQTPLIKKLFKKPNSTIDLNFPTPGNLTSFFDEFMENQNLSSSNMDYRVNAELLLSLFCTKPFYADAIEGHVQKPSEFDYVFAVYANDKNCGIDETETKKLVAGADALKELKQYGDNVFTLKTLRAEATIRNRKTGEIL